MVLTAKSKERKARRLAARVGLCAKKSRAQESIGNLGGFMLVDAIGNFVVAGSEFDLSPDDVIKYCKERLEAKN